MNPGIATCVFGLILFGTLIVIIFIIQNTEYQAPEELIICNNSQCLLDLTNGGKKCGNDLVQESNGLCVSKYACPNGFYAIKDNLASTDASCSDGSICPCTIYPRTNEYRAVNFISTGRLNTVSQSFYNTALVNSNEIYMAPLLSDPSETYADADNIVRFNILTENSSCIYGYLTPVVEDFNALNNLQTYIDKLRYMSYLEQQCSYVSDITGINVPENDFSGPTYLDSKTYAYPPKGTPYYDPNRNVIDYEYLKFYSATGTSNPDYSASNFKTNFQHQFFYNNFPNLLSSYVNPTILKPTIFTSGPTGYNQILNLPDLQEITFEFVSGPTINTHGYFENLSFYSPTGTIDLSQADLSYTINNNFGENFEILMKVSLTSVTYSTLDTNLFTYPVLRLTIIDSNNVSLITNASPMYFEKSNVDNNFSYYRFLF
jgi:hypothetical protein